MGLLDKVKEQAATATAAAKDVAQRGQDKLDTIQAKRAADTVLRDLGLLAFAEHMSRAIPNAEAHAERLLGTLKAHEQAHGQIPLDLDTPGAASPSNQPPPTGSSI